MKISNDAQKYSEYAARLNRAVMAASGRKQPFVSFDYHRSEWPLLVKADIQAVRGFSGQGS
jgi:hypothetical protein